MTPMSIDPERLERNWHAIQAELDAPPQPRIERLLSRVGMPSRLTRLVGATPSLRRAWLFSTLGILIVGLGQVNSSEPRESFFAFLLVVPLIPVLGVAMAFGPANDPAYEVSLAAPVSGLRLVLLRTLVVTGLSVALLSVGALLSPAAGPLVFAWLLPALALVALTLALSTAVRLRRAALTVSLGWLVVATLGRGGADPLSAFMPGAQIVALSVVIVAGAFVYIRRDRFDLLVEAE